MVPDTVVQVQSVPTAAWTPFAERSSLNRTASSVGAGNVA